MEKEKTGTATHGWQHKCFQPLALEEMASFVDLREGQCYLWDPQIKTNKWVSAITPSQTTTLSLFLTRQTFTLWTWFGQFNELQRSCVWGPKHFAQHALGTILQVWWTCHLTGWNLKALPWKEEETGTATHGWWCECFQPLISEEMASFVDLREGQCYL